MILPASFPGKNVDIHRKVQLTSYTSYRLFLQDYAQERYLAKGKSYRAFAKACGLSSPNYFQRVITGQQNMTALTAEKLAKALRFKRLETAYFLLLVKFDGTKDADKRIQLLDELRRLALRSKARKTVDPSFHGHWLHQVIWALAQTHGFQADPAWLQRAIKGNVTIDEIERSLRYLRAHGYLLSPDADGAALPDDADLVSDNDVRNLDLQRIHHQFLKLAQLKLNERLASREFQGMTFAFRKSRIPEVKAAIRAFVEEFSDKVGHCEEPDIVLGLEIAAFTLADPETEPKDQAHDDTDD